MAEAKSSLSTQMINPYPCHHHGTHCTSVSHHSHTRTHTPHKHKSHPRHGWLSLVDCLCCCNWLELNLVLGSKAVSVLVRSPEHCPFLIFFFFPFSLLNLKHTRPTGLCYFLTWCRCCISPGVRTGSASPRLSTKLNLRRSVLF